MQTFKSVFKSVFGRHKLPHQNNIQRLQVHHSDVQCKEKNRIILNMSPFKPDLTELSFVSSGRNSSTGAATDKKLVREVENAVRQVDPEHCNEARTRVVSVVSRLRARPSSSPFSSEGRQAVKKLHDNCNIGIFPADKGRATVLLGNADYSPKV